MSYLGHRHTDLLICTRAYHGWLEREMARLYKAEHFAVAIAEKVDQG